MHGTAPGAIERDEIFCAGLVSHVPKIRSASLKAGFRPWRPDSMVMHVIRRVVVRHDFTRWRKDRVNISGAFVFGVDVGPGQHLFVHLIIQDRRAAYRDMDALTVSLGLNSLTRLRDRARN